MCGHTKNYMIKNVDIQGKVELDAIEVTMRKNWLRMSGHVNRRPTTALVRRCEYQAELGLKV